MASFFNFASPSRSLLIFLFMFLFLHTFDFFASSSSSSSSTLVAALYSRYVDIGLLLTLDSTGCNINPNCYAYTTGQPAGLAIEAAIEQINARTDLLQNTGLRLHTNDTKCNGVQMDTLSAAVYQRETYNVVAFLGEGESEYALPAAWVSTIQSVPQISFAATSPLFDDNKKFPNFFRTIGNIAKQCTVLVNFIYAMGWRRYAYVSSVNSLALSSAQEFKAHAQKLGMTLVSGQVVSPGQTAMDYQLQLIKQARAHVIALFCSTTEAAEIIRVAIAQGLSGAKFQWVSHWDLMTPAVWTDQQGNFLSDIYNFSQHMIGILPHVEYASASYKAFAKLYSSKPLNPKYASQFQKQPNTRAALAFDATYALALAIDQSVENRGNYPPNPKAIAEQIGTMNFMGSTGQVQFDAGGSRIMPYDVVQMQDGSFVPLAVSYPPNYDIAFSSSDPINRGFRFVNNIKVLDDDDRTELTAGSTLMVVAMIIAIVGFALVMFVWVHLWLNEHRANIKPQTPKFSRVALLGCLAALGGLIFSPMDPGNTSLSTWQKSCQANLWCLEIAYILILGALLAKARKIHFIHAKQGLQVYKLSDKNLMRMIGLMLVGDLIILGVWTAMDPLKATFVVDATPVIFRPVCSSEKFSQFNAVSMAYKAVLLVWAWVANLKSRRTPAPDAQPVHWALVNLTVIGVVISPIAMTTTELSMFNVVKIFGLFFGIFVTVFALFGTFLWNVILDSAALDVEPPTNIEKRSSQLPNSVQDVLAVRARSRFFTRKCYCSEKRVKGATSVILAALMTTYSYLNVTRMLDAYDNPEEFTKSVDMPSFKVPGILICQAANITSEFLNPTGRTLYGDPRIGFDQYRDAGIPNAPPGDFLSDCCLSNAAEFYTDCYTNLKKCPTPVRYRPQIRGSYGVWSVAFDCIDIAPGITVPSSAYSLFVPYFLVTDRGFLSSSSAGFSNATDIRFDPAYINFTNNYQYWPNKLVLFSYLASENKTNPIDVYYGVYDSDVGGSQGRWRIDMSRQIVAISISQSRFLDLNGKEVPARSGYQVSFNLDIPPIPFRTFTSSWNPSRLKTFDVAYCRIYFSLSLSLTQPQIVFDYKDLITTVLAIISASGVIIRFFVGPGDYDPKGCLNKAFYFDVPTMKGTATSQRLEATEGKKTRFRRRALQNGQGGDDDDSGDDSDDEDSDDDGGDARSSAGSGHGSGSRGVSIEMSMRSSSMSVGRPVSSGSRQLSSSSQF